MAKFQQGFFVLLFVIAFLPGCNRQDRLPVPTYFHVDSFEFKRDALRPVDSLTDINAVAVYYNNISVGIFDLPATIPVPASGTGQLLVSPVIAVNGFNDHEAIYPFYTNDTITFEARPGQVISYTPVTSYYPTASVSPIGPTATGASGFCLWKGNKSIDVLRSGPDLYDGAATLNISLASSGDSSIDSTANTFSISAHGNAFIELDYRCTVPFSLGLQANLGSLARSSPVFRVNVAPSPDWRKFYFYVSDFASETGGTSFNLFVKATLPPDLRSGDVFLANIRLLTFE